ncbi:MAG: DUF402 domain-containing protein [Candidatus Methanomethylicia archaeon]|nr:DUF402 domain-containing protein [Candidatus Methanomethylicia archaeon]MCX8168846.1 DUF402 domain-containing protein [Candidatus Methanomethylicia archaeon]MDW7988578.1 DUF402 domain-containing protein [Nitrososphaerota archaeon]
MRVRIRGIYATALSRIFMNENCTIVQPSEAIKDRFDIDDEVDFVPYDVDIFDRDDKHGVYILSPKQYLNKIRSILHRYLFDAVIRIAPYSVSGIYKGIIEAVDKFRNIAYVSIKPYLKGVLHISEGENLSVGNEIPVQVDKRRLSLDIPNLTSRIGLAGKYTVLFKDGGLKLSRRARSMGVNIDRELIDKCEKILPKGFGIIFRSSFKSASHEEILNEISNLVAEYNKLMNLFNISPKRSLLSEGYSLLIVEFPQSSKRIMDSIRNFVTPTIPLHHYFKVLSIDTSKIVDYAESLISNGIKTETLIESLNNFRKSLVDKVKLLEHVKLNGKIFTLGNIEQVRIDGNCLIVYRRVKSPGVYDGLNITKNIGDKIVTKIFFDKWYYISKYYSVDGSFLGGYINVNTPIEIYSDRIRYVDLEVDICFKPNGEIKILDMNSLRKAFNIGIISECLYMYTYKLVEELKNKILSGDKALFE